jgi:hypothetical protein
MQANVTGLHADRFRVAEVGKLQARGGYAYIKP